MASSIRNHNKHLARQVVLAISGSIAAYKAADLVSLLKKQGVAVRVILTESASQFVSPLVLETLSGFPARSRLFGSGISGTEHIEIARFADLMVFAPATANLIAKLSLGLADDLVTTVALATRAPWLIAPAMNTVMWQNPVTQKHVTSLTERGVTWVAPEAGLLACGEEGEGRLASVEPIAQKILECLEASKHEQSLASPFQTDASVPHSSAAPSLAASLKNQKILITAGPTVSRIDAVRYLTNPSTGQMGAALAEEALLRGAEVFYFLGRDKGVVYPNVPAGTESRFHLTEVETAEEMLSEALKALPRVTGVIAASAVLDYRVKETVKRKLKRSSEPTSLELLPSVDVLGGLRAKARKSQWFFGFAAETERLQTRGAEKRRKKNLDFLFVNRIAKSGEVLKTGFGVSTNGGLLLRRQKKSLSFPVVPKRDLARALLHALSEEL